MNNQNPSAYITLVYLNEYVMSSILTKSNILLPIPKMNIDALMLYLIIFIYIYLEF